MAILQKYYVYTLSDPRTGVEFYVGKGCRDRSSQHVRDVKRGRVINTEKTHRIIDILASGHAVIESIIARFDTEEEALAVERQLIACRRSELTNVGAGGFPQSEAAKNAAGVQSAARLLAKVKPYPDWCRERSRSDEEKRLYRFCVAGLSEIAQRGAV